MYAKQSNKKCKKKLLLTRPFCMPGFLTLIFSCKLAPSCFYHDGFQNINYKS